MIKLRISKLNHYLKSKAKEELELEIVDLYKKFSQIQEHYFSLLNPDDKSLLNKYKKVIEKEFRPFGTEILRYSIIKKAIKDFLKLSSKPEDVAELLIYTVELGVNFTQSFGDIDQSFYNSNVQIYQQALQHITENHLEHLYYERALKIMKESNNIGWGFDFAITDIFSDFLGDFEEE